MSKCWQTQRDFCASERGRRFSAALLAVTLPVGLLFSSCSATLARSAVSELNLPLDGQQQLSRSLGYLRSNNWPRAAEAAELAVAGAPDVKTCLDCLTLIDKYGAPATKARRACLSKALNLATTHEELEEVAFRARQAGCFDLSKQALDSLVGSTASIAKLTELAFKAQHAALPDIAHVAMEKAYKLVNNRPDAMDFIQQTHSLGLDDLTRQALRDLIDDDDSVRDMITLIPTLDQYKMNDMLRYLLKAGLEKAKDTDEMLAVYDNAKKYDQPDIVKVAQYRGRKMVLLKKLKSEEAARAEEEARAAAEAAQKAKDDPSNGGQKPMGL